MKWLLLTAAHHQHAQNIVRALFDHDALGIWQAGLVFSPRFAAWCSSFLPDGLCRTLDRRVIRGAPFDRIRTNRRWEMARLVARHLRLGMDVEDRLWERGEYVLDARGCRWMERGLDGVIGFEHGCLGSLQVARELGRPSVVVFASVHHRLREKWVDPEYVREPDWADRSETVLAKRGVRRDQRRDREAETAGRVVANSRFTRSSLLDAGVPADKVVAVPLGLPPPQPEAFTREGRGGPLKIVYAGTVALHKGFHYLQRAMLALNSPHLSLDVYGPVRVKRSALAVADHIHFHGAVSADRLARAYREADLLVFPTLCDGFGQVVAEALSWGVPVICSENSGAADFIRDGENGYRVRAADVQALTDALARCLDERGKLPAMREAAVRTVREWTWGHFREAWYQTLQGAVKRE